MFVFDSYVPGAFIGERQYLFDQAALDQWLTLFPDDADGTLMPPGMMAAVTIRAYADILQPRPPGNVHAAQSFNLVKRPALGARLTTRLSCSGKELKNGRRWVRFRTETTVETGAVAFNGDMTVIWAA